LYLQPPTTPNVFGNSQQTPAPQILLAATHHSHLSKNPAITVFVSFPCLDSKTASTIATSIVHSKRHTMPVAVSEARGSGLHIDDYE